MALPGRRRRGRGVAADDRRPPPPQHRPRTRPDPSGLAPHAIGLQHSSRLHAQETDVAATPPPGDALEAVRKTFRYFVKTQTEDGHWACDYGGPLFLLPGT